MPKAPPHACHVPTCGVLIPRGEQCPHHARPRERGPWQGRAKAQVYDQARGTAHQRGYGAKWRKAQSYKLAQSPLCEHCQKRGEVKAATEVHHIVPLDQGGSHEPSNLLSLCRSCHWRETVAEQRGEVIE